MSSLQSSRKSESSTAGITECSADKSRAVVVTDYQARVYALVSTIPRGQVSTYGAISDALKSSPRAVGQALRKNPFAPEVPCHRVITSSFEIGGFNGSWGCSSAEVLKKLRLLSEEGVEFDENGSLVNAQAVAVDSSKLKELFSHQEHAHVVKCVYVKQSGLEK